jgi:hypothetical protein
VIAADYRSLLERPASKPKYAPSPLLNPQFAASKDCLASSALGGFGMKGSTCVTTKQATVIPATNQAAALKDISGRRSSRVFRPIRN